MKISVPGLPPAACCLLSATCCLSHVSSHGGSFIDEKVSAGLDVYLQASLASAVLGLVVSSKGLVAGAAFAIFKASKDWKVCKKEEEPVRKGSRV